MSTSASATLHRDPPSPVIECLIPPLLLFMSSFFAFYIPHFFVCFLFVFSSWFSFFLFLFFLNFQDLCLCHILFFFLTYIYTFLHYFLVFFFCLRCLIFLILSIFVRFWFFFFLYLLCIALFLVSSYFRVLQCLLYPYIINLAFIVMLDLFIFFSVSCNLLQLHCTSTLLQS